LNSLGEQILRYASAQPEGTPVMAKELLHLAWREAIDQALSRLVRRGQLLRPSRGLYLALVRARFGDKAPDIDTCIAALAARRGEIVAAGEAAAANKLALTTQRPMNVVFLRSGPTRSLSLARSRSR
jgi:predicted transcriptional regulator of viral defense system